jgi:hypothetical protein
MNGDAHHLVPTFLRGMIGHVNLRKESKRYLSGIVQTYGSYKVELMIESIPLQITCVDSRT